MGAVDEGSRVAEPLQPIPSVTPTASPLMPPASSVADTGTPKELTLTQKISSLKAQKQQARQGLETGLTADEIRKRLRAGQAAPTAVMTPLPPHAGSTTSSGASSSTSTGGSQSPPQSSQLNASLEDVPPQVLESLQLTAPSAATPSMPLAEPAPDAGVESQPRENSRLATASSVEGELSALKQEQKKLHQSISKLRGRLLFLELMFTITGLAFVFFVIFK